MSWPTVRAPRVSVDYDKLKAAVPAAPRGAPMGTSGEFIRFLLKQAKYPDEVIAAMVRRNFADRKTTISDVAWNRLKLRRAGEKCPDRIAFTKG